MRRRQRQMCIRDRVKSVVSGYSGGHLKNPTYADVIYTDSGHVEAVEITYDSSIVNYEELLEIYWKNIDPFDAEGQFCDKGKSYRSVIFFEDDKQKKIIDESFQNLQKKLNKKIGTLVWGFEKFYQAENYHQDYYEKNPNQGYCNFVIRPKLKKLNLDCLLYTSDAADDA